MPKRERDALAQVPLFAGLAPRYLKRLADLTEEQRFMEGARVVREGDIGDTFYVILEGEAKVVSGSGRTLHRLRPGEFFGEISLLDGGPRTASVVADTQLTMLALPRAGFLRAIELEPAVGVKLLAYVATMLRRARTLGRGVIRAELHPLDDPETVVAIATWNDGSPRIQATGDEVQGLDAILRPTPVVVDDPSLRPLGTHGEVVLEPGSLEWFRAALLGRSEALGLGVRFVTDEVRGGWDPAANYRTFREQARRLASS